MEILELMGYGPRLPGPRPAEETRVARNNFWRILKMVTPGSLQYAIKNALPASMQHELLFRWYAGNRDWAGWRAIAVPNNDSVGAIRVQVKGRDKHGIVEPEEYGRVCREIRDGLNELTDPATARRVVRHVTITSEEFSGPYQEALPDLTVLWDQRFPWSDIQSPRFGKLHIRRQDGRSGSHTPHGFVIAAGPAVEARREQGMRSIYDLAPTVLAAAGVQADADLDGSPLPLQSARQTVR